MVRLDFGLCLSLYATHCLASPSISKSKKKKKRSTMRMTRCSPSPNPIPFVTLTQTLTLTLTLALTLTLTYHAHDALQPGQRAREADEAQQPEGAEDGQLEADALFDA
jgi:hypothetical protein